MTKYNIFESSKLHDQSSIYIHSQAHLFENQIDYIQKSILKLYQDWNWNWETFNSLVADVAVILNVQFLNMLLAGLRRVPDLGVRVQVRVLVICVSTSASPSTWLLHEYE